MTASAVPFILTTDNARTTVVFLTRARGLNHDFRMPSHLAHGSVSLAHFEKRLQIHRGIGHTLVDIGL